ncbi:MAG TPA: CDP-diacylglycerol--serine O-phosphatidyltransferase [Desulfatiglandales bacterium]|nr:CDP-diacylglycerol--serine O-phosphatidyltransferase [Desulfatiglandales bacterium]
MRQKRKKRFRRTGGKGIFILPNLFTSSSLFCGFFAIISSIQGRYEAAAIAIVIAAIFDGLDGRIARFTKTSSLFGVEYDSLSDLVSFGVAPAILAFLWALKPFGRLGWLAAFMYVICGALRLARFNVEKSSEQTSYFKGLPIPAAACFLASIVLYESSINGFSESRHIISIVIIYVLSFLMVSSIRYTSFKEFNIRNQKPFNVLVAIILVFIVIAYKPNVLLFLIMLLYTLSGPVIFLYPFRVKRYKANDSLDIISSEDKGEDDLKDFDDQEITR